MRRLFIACSIALLAAIPLGALTESAQAPTWPTTRVDRESQEGEAITIGFQATPPSGQTVTYSSPNLPKGLTINPTTGVVSGTLELSPAGQVDGGAAGIHNNVTIVATSSSGASSSYVFDWRVSRFKKGDVFAGVGDGRYRVFSENGEFKYELTVETEDDWVDYTGFGYGWGGGLTTGCGYNWATRNMYFTNFDDDYDPTVAEWSTVPVGGQFVRPNMIHTFRDAGVERGGAPSGMPIDAAPESVTFGTDPGPDGQFGTPDDIQGVLYIGHSGGYYSPDPVNLPEDYSELHADINDRAIFSTDDWSNFYYVDGNGDFILDNSGNRIPIKQGYDLDNYLSAWIGNVFLGQDGLPIQAFVQWGRDIQKWLPDGSGGWVRAVPDPDTAPLVEGFDTHSGWQGSDTIDLAADQRTMFYTSEWGTIYRYDVGPNPPGGVRQLKEAPENPDPDAPQVWPYASLGPRDPLNPLPRVFYGLRILPPGDGSGGVLVAEDVSLKRINANGVILNEYDAPGVDGWFAVNISPNGKSVWSASTTNGRIYRWSVVTGQIESLPNWGQNGFPSGADVDPSGRHLVEGLCVMGEYTAAQEVCGDGIDNDEDGEVDENCQPLEACHYLSPGDDDGDGLVDTNDPDCPSTTNLCAATGYTGTSVAGYCARFNREGDTISIRPAPGPVGVSTVEETFELLTPLPPGITMLPNGTLSGTVGYATLKNPPEAQTEVFNIQFRVRNIWKADGSVAAEFVQSFPWTIQNVNQPPVAADFTKTIRPGQSASFEPSHQTGVVSSSRCSAPGPVDPDCEDTVTVTGNTTPTVGTLVKTGDIYTWTAPPTFTGVVTYTYTISDGQGSTDTGQATITVVNTPPDAVDDTATTRPAQAVSINVLTNDSDADVAPTPGAPDTLTVTANTNPSNGTVSMTSNGTFIYTPNSGFLGTDSFTYTITDGYNVFDTATVTITVRNVPPVAIDDAATTRPGIGVSLPVLTMGTPDSDADGDTLTVVSNTNPSNGTVTKVGNVFTYVSTGTFVGTDSFTYTISDGFGGTDTAVVTITINNRPPVATNDAVPVIQAGPTAGASFNVLTMGTPDSDPDGDTFTLTSFTQPGAGTLTRTSGGNFTWTAPPGYSGQTTFTYTITDQYGLTSTATVTITVRNLPPVAVNDTATTAGTQPVGISVLANDSDPDLHAISITGATTPANGTAVVNANGTITYTANPGFQGIDTFFYTIKDGYGGESTATVTVTVGPPSRFDPCFCASAQASPAQIWPPNHKKTEVVTITGLVDPDGGPVDVKILGIYQDEPTNYLGDGTTTIDAGGVGTSQAWVRAERTGNPNVPGNGRVYEIVFEATAPDGSSCRGSVFTGVPHDQGQGNTIIDDGIRYDSTVAGGPIVRNALQVQDGLSDEDVTERGFELKYVAEARIAGSGSGTANDEMLIGPTVGSTSDTDDFNWSNGGSAYFLLWKTGDTVHFKLLTSNQFEYVTYSANCANGECNDIFLRAEAGGTGKITLSSLNINGLPISETIVVNGGEDAESIHLSGLSLDEGVLLGGIVKIEWGSPKPTGSTVNFRVMVGSACPEVSGGGGGGEGTPPLARSDAYTTNEDTPLTVDAGTGILLNDLTFGGPLTASLVSTTSNGTLTLNADGSFTYVPAPNFNGQDTFTYLVSDGTRTSEPALVTITVLPIVDPPVAVNDSATTDENTPVTIAVTTNDSDPFGATLAVTSLTQPSNGTATVSGTSVIYTPAPGFIGVDTFTYTVTGTEGTATATVTVTVVNVNEPPVAVNNSYTTAEDTPLTIAAPGILANDSDPDAGDTITAFLVTGPSNGTVTLNANGSFVYTPALNYTGTDSYTYRVRDAGGLESNIATVTITITAVPDPPVAVDDSYVVAEDSVLTISTPGVKVNDSDPDTPVPALTVTLVTGTQRGSLTLATDGSFVYTPFPEATGSDSFVYRLSDGTGESTATVTIAITEVPDPPMAIDDTATTTEDTPVTINVLGNDTDPDTEVLTITGFTQAANGTVTSSGGQLVYTPAPNFNGIDTFTYTITDGQASSTATVTVTVNPGNDPPVASPDSYTTPRNTPLTVPAPGVLENDSDPDNDAITVAQTTTPANGTVTPSANGGFVYTPNTGFVGIDTFTYVVTDGELESAPTTVTITVTAVNTPPIAVDDTTTTNAGQSVTIPVLTNDSDPDGDTISVTTNTNPSNGTVTRTGDAFVYTPAPGFTGTDTFTYTIADSSGATATATVTITVSQVCAAPGPGALVRRSATFHGGGIVDGNVQVLTAADVVFNSQTRLNGDLFMLGMPTVQTYPPVTYAGTQDGTGAATPTSHRVTIYGGATLGHVVRRTDAIAMPVVANPPAPAGTRYVSLNNPGDSAGDFATIRDLTLNSGAGTRTIPAGTYGNFTTNAPSTFVFGVAGATEPAVYNFESLTINSSSALTVVGPVVITVRNYLNAYGSPLGNSAHPEWLTIRVASTNGFRLNSNVPLWGYVEAPNGPITIDGGAVLTGGIAADTFTLNGQGRLVLVPRDDCQTSNQPPVAQNDAYTTPMNTALTVPAAGTLANDSDPDAGDTLTAVLVSNPANGSVTLAANGSFVYTPATGFSGTDTFTYRVRDNGGLESNIATVTITVTSSNAPPVAVDDSTVANGTDPVTIAVLGNDSDPDGDVINVTDFTQPSSGTVTKNGNTFVYTAVPGFSGTVTFTYTISDAGGLTDTATVTITVSSVCEAGGVPGGLVRRSTMFDAFGRVEGSVQMMTAESATFNSNTVLDGDLFIVGTPEIQINGTPTTYGGAVDGSGSATPASHRVYINAAANLGRIVRRTDAIALPTVANPPSPTGTRNVTMNSPSDDPGSFATIRNLTLNSNIGPVAVPPGTYDTFIAGPNSSFVIGVAGATEPSVYNFQTLTLNAGSSRLTVVGPVILTVRYGATWHGPMGAQAHPEWLTLRVATNTVQLDSQMQFYGRLEAPNSQFIVNSGTLFHGSFAVDAFTVNSNGRVVLVPGDCVDPNQPPVAANDSYTTPRNTPLTVPAPGVMTNDSDPDGDAITAAIATGPSHGTVTLNANGSFTYTPANNYTGADAFTYTVSDGSLSSAPATANITITAVNAPPVASNDVGSTRGTMPLSLAVLLNDTDPDGDTLTITSRTSPAHGTAVINANGTITYVAAAGYTGPDQFTYTISDGKGGTSTATVFITVTAANRFDDCTCASATASVHEIYPANGSQRNVTITGVTDPNGGPVTIKILKIYQDEPTNYGNSSIDAGGIGTSTAWVRAEETGRSGGERNGRVYEIEFEAVAQDGSRCTGSVFTGVTYDYQYGTDYVAFDDGVRYDSTVLSSSMVSSNDVKVTTGLTDAQVEDLNFTPAVIGQGRIGGSSTYELSIGASSSSWSDTDSFTWTSGQPAMFLMWSWGNDFHFKLIDDNQYEYVTFPLTCANGQCNDIVLRAQTGGTGRISLSSLTLNGLSLPGGITLGTGASAQSIHISGTNLSQGFYFSGIATINWSSTKPTNSTVSFQVRVGDACPDDEPDEPAPTAPVAVNDSYTVPAGGPLTIDAPGILINDTGTGLLTVQVLTQPAHGTLVPQTNGSFLYTPHEGYSGADSFTYRVMSGTTAGNTATVSLTIEAPVPPPVAVNDSYNVEHNTTLNVSAPGVLGNDTGQGPLTVEIVSQPSHGTVTLNTNGSFAYTPSNGYAGTDTFTYRVKRGSVNGNTATVTLTIAEANQPPVASDDSYTTTKGTPLTISAPGILANDSDPNAGDTLTAVGSGSPSSGSVVIDANGSFTYTPTSTFTGVATFRYRAKDSKNALSNEAIVTITVKVPNTPPVAANDAYTATKNQTLVIQAPGVLANDSDANGDALTVVLTSPATKGTVTLNANGSFSYVPQSNYVGTATFKYKAKDTSDALSNEATVTITITEPNRPPVASNDSYTTNKNVTLTVSATGILGNDSDPDTGDTLTTQLVSGPPSSAGTLTLNANGSFTFVPKTDYSGTTTFRYRAVDSSGAQSNEATVTIVVKNVPSSGRVCYDGGSGKTEYTARIDWTRLDNGDIQAIAYVSRNYADNTYGVNKIGWGSKNRDFKAVYLSDFGQFAFYDANGTNKIEFKIDYLSPKSDMPSGYGTWGVTSAKQAEGGMVGGNESNIVMMTTSMDLNMNAFGYVSSASNHPLKSYSPATNSSYTPNSTYPNWIWDMAYLAVVKESTFGSAGFGSVALRALHASPSKATVSTWREINCQ